MNRIQKLNNLVSGFRKSFYKARKLKLSITDPDFKIFKNIEFNTVKPEDIKDIKRLNYLRVLELSEKGYVNNSTKSLISHYKLKDEYHNKNSKITPIGNIKALDDNKLRKHVIIGFDKADKTYKISSSNIDYIPIWKPLDKDVINQEFSKIYSKNDKLMSLESHFFKHDITDFDVDLKKQIETNFNATSLKVFNSNKLFKQSIRPLAIEDLSDPKTLNKSFSISFDDSKQLEYYQVKDLNEDYISLKPIFNADNSKVKIISREDIKAVINYNSIEIISKLDHNLTLGLSDGKLLIGQQRTKNGLSKMSWSDYDSFKNNGLFTDQIKAYVSKNVILDKNFLKENNKVILKNDRYTAVIKEHYASKKLFFGLHNNGATNYKAIDEKLHQFIVDNFNKDPNLKSYLKLKPITNNKINQNILAQ